ncbi:MAG: CoA transferase [Chloroflexi bacterium]|nr:CoA transferase [Chloroflexota bacterium]
MVSKNESMLGPYRVLDLTDEKGLLCGKMLGDMGADVIKVEKPGGDLARSIGPFYHDEPHPEKSLFWFAMNTSKRGITLDIETADGKALFKTLVKTTDFVIESEQPGYLDKLGLGYKDLEKINPGIILVSITPFGQTGPYKDWKTSDIVAWAMAGEMYMWGEASDPPVRISGASQAYMCAGADGCMGAVTALLHRSISGEGQQVDISVYESCVQIDTSNRLPAWQMRGTVARRGGGGMGPAKHVSRKMYRCKDGWVNWSYRANPAVWPSKPLVNWMEAEGASTPYVSNFDFARPDFNQVLQDEWNQLEEPTAKFFMSKTKAELLDGAIKWGVMLYPVSTTADMMGNPQLIARDFWKQIKHTELKTTITYPGPFVIASGSPVAISRRAPLIGEHNAEIYEKELGYSKEQLAVLKEGGII